eukprot:scaffold651945_cov43-Prasinocladus_malaysianus.AAC.1
MEYVMAVIKGTHPVVCNNALLLGREGLAIHVGHLIALRNASCRYHQVVFDRAGIDLECFVGSMQDRGAKPSKLI